MRAGRRKQRVTNRPRKEGAKTIGSPSATQDSAEGTELPEIRSPRGEEEEPEDEVEEPETEPPSVPTSPAPSHELTPAQREEEMESKNQAARILVEERRLMLEQQELQRREKEQNNKRQQRHDRHKKMRAGSIEKSNRGPGSESEEDETKPRNSDSDHSFVESSDDENPFELCYSPDKSKPTSTFREAAAYHRPDITGYQQENDRKILIEDNYKGVPSWEPAQGGIASCWSGVVSQLCGSSSHIWLNLPLVSMFAYDPVPDSDS